MIFNITKGKKWAFWLCMSFIIISCQKEKETKDKPTIAPPVKVEVIEAMHNSIINKGTYSGTVSSAETTNVSFNVAGTITDLYAKEGQKVSKGQLLGRVRNSDYQNAYNIAQAQLAEAQDGYNRLQKLHDAKALPDVKWVEMEQKLKQAKNTEEMAKRTLNDANLYSPISGTITKKYADEGQTVVPVQPIYEIVSTNKLEMDISVSEGEVGKFKIGDRGIVTLESLGEATLEGRVIQKSVVADPLTRTYTVKVSIPDANGKILPGMIGEVTFENLNNTDQETSGIILPSQAVMLNDDNRWFVWVVNDSLAERRFVSATEMTANGVVVNSGLTEGDKVIIKGMQKVGTGSRVVW